MSKKSSGSAASKRPDGMPVGTPFAPGTSGNPDGRPKGLRNSKTILRELLEITETVTSGLTGESHEVNQLDIILTKLVVMAKNGDLASVDRVLDRLEGRPETTSKTVNLNIEAKPDELDKLTDDQIARMAQIAKESSNG